MSLGSRRAAINSKQIVRSGLVLHLDAARPASYPGSGTTWTDLSGQGNNGTLTNGPTFNSANGGIIDFDGTDDFCNLNAPASLNNQYATHEVWVKLDSPNNGIAQQIIARRNTSLGTFTMALSAFNRLVFNTRNSSDTIFGLQLNTLPSTNWVHLVHSYDGTTISAYVNGVLDASTTSLSGPLNTGGSFDIVVAQNNNNANRMDGKIGLVRVYNRALSLNEVKQNYEATKARYVDFSIPVGEG